MYKKILTLVLLALAMPGMLAGCGADAKAQVDSAAQTAPLAELLRYYDGDIISPDGKVRFESGDNNFYQIYDDAEGRQKFVLEIIRDYDYERISRYNQPIITATIYRVYDLQGELLHETKVAAECEYEGQIEFAAPPDGDWRNSRITVDRLTTEGCFRIYNMDGEMMLEKQLLAAEDLSNVHSANCFPGLTENLMWVHCNIYANDYDHNMEDRVYFYTPDGAPLEMAHDYLHFYGVYDEFSNKNSGYFTAYYVTDNEQGLYDILDAKGKVILGGCTWVENYADGVFTVQRGFKRGLVNTQGEWIYQESIFSELDD